MAEDLFDSDVNGPDGESTPLTGAPVTGAPLTAAPAAGGRSVNDTVAAEVEDLFDLAPMSVSSNPMEPSENDDSEAWEEETVPVAARPSARVKHGAPGSRHVWLWVAFATVVNLGVAGVVIFKFDRNTSKIIEQIDKRPVSDLLAVPAEHVAIDSTAPESPDRGASPANNVSPGPDAAPVNHETPELVIDMHPAIVKAKKLELQDHMGLRDASALLEKGNYTEARKKYFEVLLSAVPELDGRDVTAAKLGIARCLSREGFSALAARGDHK